MKPTFIANQLVLFAGLFLLINITLFVPTYYHLQFETGICDNANNPDLSGIDNAYSQEYYRDACNSVLKAWQHHLEPPLTFKFHLIPLLIAGIVTAVYSYYKMLDYQFKGGYGSDG